jgi:hypothetical protein
MITEDYVSFETAKLLKEKGFDENIDLWYDENGETFFRFHYAIRRDWRVLQNQKVYECPTLQMAMKWLREEKGFHIFVPNEIDYDEDERGDRWYHQPAYYPEIRRVSDGKIMYDDGSLYATPEQACDVAIKYCLENLI